MLMKSKAKQTKLPFSYQIGTILYVGLSTTTNLDMLLRKELVCINTKYTIAKSTVVCRLYN